MRDNEAKVTREGLPASSVPDLERRLEKLNRRARKLGVPELRLSVSEERLEALTDNDGVDRGKKRRVVDVEVSGATPKLDGGWELVAVVEHDEGENLTRAVPGVEADLRPYRDSGPNCAHCGMDRRRLETFVVRNERGVLSQVGRNCLADFLGGQSPQGVLWLAGWVAEVSSDDFWGSESSREDYLVDPANFLAKVATLLRVDGWMGRTKAREWGKVATVDDAWVLTFPPLKKDDKWRAWAEARESSDADRETGKAALAWAEALDPDDPNEYRSNLGRVARKEAWSAKRVGLGGSAVFAHLRELEREVAFKKASEGFKREHLGKVGERLRDLEVELVSTRSFENDWGASTLVILVDSERHRLKWWASGSKYTTSEPGLKLRVDATVKKHEEYKGMLETVVSRVKELSPAEIEKRAAKAERAAKRAAKKAKVS